MVERRRVIGISLIAATLVAMAFLSTLPGPERVEVFVSPGGDDSWSGRHPAPRGSGDGPFATIERASKEVGMLVEEGLKKDVVVWIREGTYYLPEGLVIGPSGSGSEDHSITYSAYPGEEASIIGGVRLFAWERVGKGEVWWTAVPEGYSPAQLFEEGGRMQLARSPNYGYFEVEGPVPGRDTEAFVYRPGDIDPEGWAIAGGRVFLWPGHDWYSAEKEIVSIDPGTRTILMGSDEGYPMVEGNRYFVRNVLSLLDIPGECQIDLGRGRIYCWPSEPIEDRTMVASTARNVIRLEGAEANPVRNVHFENLDLGICNEDVFCARMAEDCSLRFCRVENGGQSGVLLANHIQRFTVYGNLIRFNGLHGVSLQGLPVGGEDVNHHNIVENNHIHHCGELVGHGYGVRISQSGHNSIVHNHIHDMPRYGTSIKGMYFQWMLEQLEGVTWENHYDYLHSRNNTLAYNHIHHVNLDSQDTGAMESWGSGRDNVYDHNLIHDTGNSQLDYQKGIYLDGSSDYFTVTNNIIYGVMGAGNDVCISATGVCNVFDNNILVVGPGNLGATHIIGPGDDVTRDHQYTHNIFYVESADGHVHSFTFWGEEHIALSDYNLYWKSGGELTIGGGPANGPFDNWLSLLDGRFDGNSVIADPLFVDPGRRDYRLREDSPALQLGFEGIDTGGIGLKDDFPARLAESIEERFRIPSALVYRAAK